MSENRLHRALKSVAERLLRRLQRRPAEGAFMTSAEEAEDQDERQVFCSGCLQVFSEFLVHVIPHFAADRSRAASLVYVRSAGLREG
jgi:hypothetical protein